MMCVNNGNEQLLNQLAEQHEQHGYHTASSVFQSYRKYAYLHQLASQSTEGGLIILFVTSSQTTHCSCQ